MSSSKNMSLNIIQKNTPNFNVGRDGLVPDCIVIHISTGSFASCINWFADPSSKVSSHYLISLTGQVVQFVKEEDTAWANGVVVNPTSKLVKSRVGVNPNKYTISIEHEGKDLSQAPQAQIEASARLIKEIATRWSMPIDREHIIGHNEIKSTKPFCPATNMSVVDTIITKAKGSSSTKEDLLKKVEELKELIKTL